MPISPFQPHRPEKSAPAQNRAGAEEGRRAEIAAYSVGFWISRSGLTLRRMKNATIPKMAI